MPRQPIINRIFDAFQRAGRGWRRLVTQFCQRPLFKSIGPGSTLYPFYLLANPQYIRIGARTVVRRGCRMEVVLHGQPWVPEIRIGDQVNIEQNVHLICHDRIIIGDRVSITGHCAIVDVTHPSVAALDGGKIGEAIDPARSSVEIGEGSFIGFGTVIMPNVRIGKNCVIGAGSVVTRDIPDYMIAAGSPARPVGKVERDLE